MVNTTKIKIGAYVYNPTQKIEGTVTEINRTKHEATVRVDSGDEVLFVSSPLAQLIEVKRTERKTFSTATVSTQHEQTLDIKVKYFDKEIDKITKIEKGDWIDLRAAEDVELKKGQFKLIPLGVGMKLPEGYEANIVPRSSTFKKYGIIQTNHFAVIDESYSGENDQWMLPVYALKASSIKKNERICQFRINKKMPEVTVTEVEYLDEVSRGGFGSTGSE